MNRASQHKNSRPITIFRSATFLGAAQGADVQPYMAMAKMSIGSYWESTSSKRIGSGLLLAEIDILLPKIIEVTAEHPEFVKRVNIFYSELMTPVPYKTGVKLETGLFLDNEAQVSKENLPLEVMDYIRWRHALGNPQVATSKDFADGNASKLFYIFDKSVVDSKQEETTKVKDAAMQLYMTMKDKIEKVTMMLTLLGEDTKKLPTSQDKIARLRILAETKADAMMKIDKEGDIDQRYWLKAMTDTRIIKMMHGKYFISETDKMIGQSLEEAIFFLKDEENSEMVQFLKSTLQEKQESKTLLA